MPAPDPFSLSVRQQPRPLRAHTLRDAKADPRNLADLEELIPLLAVRGRVVLLLSPPKLGKSTMLTSAVAAYTSGRTFFGRELGPGRVLWVGMDEAMRDTIVRMAQMESDEDRTFFLHRFSPGAEIEELAAEAASLAPDIIVIDTLSVFVEHLVHDENLASAWVPVMAGLRRIAENANAAILLVHHMRRGDSAHRGSSVISASADAVVSLHSFGSDSHARLLKGNGRWLIEDTAVRLSDDRRTFELVDKPTALSEDEPGVDSTADRDATTAVSLLAYVARHPGCSLSDACASVNRRAVAVREVFRQLIAQGRLVESGRGWSIPAPE